ncbi:MAG: rhodanese-like domain-containing protein [Clostridia bacterium]|nr:rhodanese-like domain-containing protein [Clostridia bacterium]
MKKIIFLGFMLLLLVGCGHKEEGKYQTITPEDAYERLQNEEILLLDVRTEEEYIVGSIPGSVLLPLDAIEDEMETLYPNKDAEIFVYCRSGNRSKTAANLLLELGYKNVYDLGGIINWPYDIY